MSLAQLLDYGIKEVPQQSEIRTETVEPNNATTDKSRIFKYTIRNVGFLEGTSMLTFKLKNIAGTDARYRVNLWNGALACIKNAHLRIGDFEVQNAQDVSRIATLLNLNKSVLQRRNVIGHYLGNQLEVQIGSEADTNRGAGTDATGAGQLWVNPTDSGVNFGTVANGTSSAVNSLSIVSNEANNERYGIPLSMIFPCLKGRSLPLFLFTDYNIQMEFEMNFSDEYAYDTSMNYSQTAVRDYMCGSTLVGFNDVNLVIDYMLPPSSVINNFLKQTQQQGGYRFEFPEISVVKKKLLAVPVSKQIQEVEHRLGQTGKEVHNIIMMKRFVDYKDKMGLTLNNLTATTTNGTPNITVMANTEKIGYLAQFSSATNFTTPHSVVNLGADGTSLVLGGNATGTGAVTDGKIVNQNSQGLGRKVLQGQSIDGCDEEEYNVEVNGLDIYPSYIYNNASQYNQMSLVLDNDLIVPRTMYFTDPNTERQRLAPLEDGLTGNYKPLGCDLRNGNAVMVGGGTVIQSGSPLIFKYKRKPRMNGSGDGTNGANNALGRAIDYRGEMDIDYYITHARVVVVKKLDKGTSVMVSS